MKSKDSFILCEGIHGDLSIREKLKQGKSKLICFPTGETTVERSENAQFLLIVLNEYANKPISTEDFNAK